MGSSYYLYQLYQRIPNQEDVPVYPPTYSIDGEGTMTSRLKKSDDCLCPEIEQMLRVWVPDGTICFDCGEDEEMTRWVVLDTATQWYCDNCPTLKLYATYSDMQTYEIECNGNGLSQTEVRAFSGNSYSAMTMADIGGCVSQIGYRAFLNCSGLTNVSISTGVTYIDSQAFERCVALTSVIIPATVITINDNAFARTALTSATVPDSVTTLGDAVFYGCNQLQNAYIGTGVTSINESLFEGDNNLEFVQIAGNVSSISNFAFNDCSRATITFTQTTPPTLGGARALNQANGGVRSIRVPGASVASYVNAWATTEYPNSYWSSQITGY